MLSALAPMSAPRALAAPASVNLAGDLQSEATAGACGDWDPGCAGSAFSAQPNDVYLFQSATIPAGDWQYKVALGSWDVSYAGSHRNADGNTTITTSGGAVRFYYDDKTHAVMDSASDPIYTVPGDFNSEIGCAGDWAPDCLGTLLTDVDGDGVFTTSVTGLPAGSYSFKVATGESWDNPNYGDSSGNNLGFTVSGPATVTFSFDSATNTPSVQVVSALPSPDNNVEWDGLRHDSRDPLYRSPAGAVKAGTPVTIRFRTFHNDVTSVTLRAYDVNGGSQRFVPMAPAATDVSCYQAGMEAQRCDFWAATLSEASPNNLWYRFIVSDGTDTDFYGDNTAALDGGLGAATDDAVDNSFALMFYDPAFSSPNWARTAVIYQIFPDRFRNGDRENDPQTGDVRYDDPVIALGWGTLPEGYCRNYTDGATNCAPRFGSQPGDTSGKEQPRGRDYFGGDLEGVKDKLDYLKKLGITTIYFNPIFAAGSNHRYDTRDYLRIDPALGDNKDFRDLVRDAKGKGINIIVDSVFNHMSSDSAFFDRYGHYSAVGACESASSIYRGWFNFRAPAGIEPAPCAPSVAGGDDTYYNGWFGFDSIPEIKKSVPAVRSYFLTGQNSVSKYWLRQGAAGWRLDVMGDASFPADYWPTFRSVTRATKPDSLIIGELWQKDSTLLKNLRGETADTTMNYRLRDAVIGLLAPGAFDSKGFGDSGRVIAPSEFASRIMSIREDYPDAAYYTLMNLLDSHDTERILWTLTPGAATTADKELNPANVAAGKDRLRLASLIQFTMPGAPTVYYGDEVGMTGGDDPDDRRTYPWKDKGGSPDSAMFDYYRGLGKLRDSSPAFTRGDIRMLLADDAAGVVAYGRRTGNYGALVAVNRSGVEQTASVPVAGYLPDGTRLRYGLGGRGWVTVQGGAVALTLPAMGGAALTTFGADLTATAAPAGLAVTDEGTGQVALSWGRVRHAAGYNVYRSPVSAGGYLKLNDAPLAGTSYTDTTVENGRISYYVVKALDNKGNESAASNEVSALPHYRIGWANLQWPPTISHTISATSRTDTIYGQVWIDGVTGLPGATPGLLAQVGYGPEGSAPTGWTWADASFNGDAGNNDEFMASLLPEAVGSYDYAYRYSTTGGRDWLYADLGGPVAAGALPGSPGKLTVSSSGDTTAPAVPAGLGVVSASPAGIALTWDANQGDASLYGYEVARGDAPGGPYTVIGLTTEASYTDLDVSQGASYAYVVRAVDGSFNRSAFSPEVLATAELRTVTLNYTVAVPDTTDATGRSVFIAGFLDRLDGGLPQWDPAGVSLTRVDATHWAISFTGKEGTQIEYKYALGSWDYVEKDGACGEIANRLLTLSYGATGAQAVNDTIDNWRNVAPCGN
ncbi:alpha-amylase [Oscillochloris sp. ZM17-4]|nr:alpha-amylase family glycosyl hydrolase [Oscillochloris sp. ZM17-4]MBX0327401.1 alpha-amylase [Oscillochloris sp. ZM17-4]